MPETDPRRRFTSRQRTALYLAADGLCELCRGNLPPNWHADHRIPHVAGGPTDSTNGDATCPGCNTKKGASMPITPRLWQRRFITKFHANTDPDFICVACPGAGKTKAAGFIARDLLQTGEVERLFIVVPTGPLRMQWHNALRELDIAVDGWTMNDPERTRKPGSLMVGEMDQADGRKIQGWVVTYQSMAMAAELHRVLNSRRRTLAILDEVHHLGEKGSWGQAAVHALGPCIKRLALSGTPFRGDGTPIPFVEYDAEGWVRYADRTDNDGNPIIYPRGFDYSYGRALTEDKPPVRPAIFEQFDGDAAWMEAGLDNAQEARISDPALDPERRRKANKHILDATGDWLRDVLTNAERRLKMVREEGDHRAKGLVVCRDTAHAMQVADVLGKLVGAQNVMTAMSRNGADDTTEEARRTIESFGRSDGRWLVAVAMVSEGVDIPELRVGVYATTVRSPLFFRQVLGRFVRWRDDLPEEVDQTAYLFISKDPAMVELADKVQDEVRTALLKELDRERGESGEREYQPSLDMDSFVRSTGEAAGILLPGHGSFDHDLVEKIAADSGNPVRLVADVLASMKRLGLDTPPAAVPTQRPADAEPVQVSYPARLQSKRALLEKNLKQLTGHLLSRPRLADGFPKFQGLTDFPSLIPRVKAHVYREAGIGDYRRADLPAVDRALDIVRAMLARDR